MSIVGPKSTADVRQFLEEASGLPVLGCEFSRGANRHLAMRCEYKNHRGETKTKRLELGFTGLSLHDEVIELTAVMSEWIQHGEGHMLELLDSSKMAGHG